MVIIQILVTSWYIFGARALRERAQIQHNLAQLAARSRSSEGKMVPVQATTYSVDKQLDMRVINIASEEDPWLIIVPAGQVL